MLANLFLLTIIFAKSSQSDTKSFKYNTLNYNNLDEHSLVTDSEVFPYVTAILKKTTYLSAGALIADKWVLTAGDALFMVREALRLVRVRLGSLNYKKGGIHLPIKNIEIHPFFDDNSPVFDLALIQLSRAVRFTPSLRAIALQRGMREPDATHYIVTSWQTSIPFSQENNYLKSMEIIKKRRILLVTHLHPSDADECAEQLVSIGINHTRDMMCLDSSSVLDPCMREVGAPVVLNDVLWGIISSWKPPNCDNGYPSSSFLTLVASPNVTNWISTIIKGGTFVPPSDHNEN